MGGSVSRKQPRERFMENLASLLPKTGTCSVNSLPEQSNLPALRQPLLIYIAMKQKSRVLTLDWEKGLYWSRARHKE
ncbi:hypothetical protein CIG19_13930 [Enterobacterales bacterium CwR94]|nr:hypothetical protein CIG19_13930 [Enterobacterales bacterium CwR94]